MTGQLDGDGRDVDNPGHGDSTLSLSEFLPIRLPDDIPHHMRTAPVIASVSGGKDSGAMALALKESGLAVLFVTAMTLWEARTHDDYLETFERALDAPIVRVGKPGGMPEQMENGRFPARQQRWCTEELKLKPLREYHDSVRDELGDTISSIGIRRDEATTFNTRGTDPEWEWYEPWDGYVWRPILHWGIEEVVAMHARHGVPMNPLYERGHDRVGCYPCIYAVKEEIRLIAKHEPQRIDEIAKYEVQGSELRVHRNRELAAAGKKPRYKHEQTTFFLTKRQGFSGIDEVVKWSKTERGGRNLPLFEPAPTGGCMKWGLCEYPVREDLARAPSKPDVQAIAAPEDELFDVMGRDLESWPNVTRLDE